MNRSTENERFRIWQGRRSRQCTALSMEPDAAQKRNKPFECRFILLGALRYLMIILLKNPIAQKLRTRHLSHIGTGLNNQLKILLLFLACSTTVILLSGCDKKSSVDATIELAASFEDSPVKEDIIKANTAFLEGRYKESLNLLHKVVSNATLTERQKKAMAGILGQLLKAVHQDPQLSKDTQLHRLMQMLVQRTMGET
jgi:hypothetical protein